MVADQSIARVVTEIQISDLYSIPIIIDRGEVGIAIDVLVGESKTGGA